MSGKAPVTFVGGGSLGDVLPLIAIGHGLAATGRRAQFAGHRRFAELAETNGLGFVDIPSKDPVEVKKHFVARGTEPLAHPSANTPAKGSAALVVTPFAGHASHVAEALKNPVFCTALHPFFPTLEFPSPFAPADFLRLRPGFALNWLSHWGIAALSWEIDRKWVNAWRREMGLDNVTRRGFLHYIRAGGNRVFFGFSPAVVHRPADWPDDLEITGYWRLKAPPLTPPPHLARFMEAVERPIFVSYGSTIDALTRRLWNASSSTPSA